GHDQHIGVAGQFRGGEKLVANPRRQGRIALHFSFRLHVWGQFPKHGESLAHLASRHGIRAAEIGMGQEGKSWRESPKRLTCRAASTAISAISAAVGSKFTCVSAM